MDVAFENSALNARLQAELASGNEIAGVSDWPPACKRLIILAYRFTVEHDAAGLTLREMNDPHDWFAEYNVDGGAEVLACRFKLRPSERS
tara:strand:- start:1696 stop:1965 length:270 start_codon:yes stop_codon:yes gene_type:complete